MADTKPVGPRFGLCAPWWYARLKGQPHSFAALGVAVAIASHVNSKTCTAWPSQETIAMELGIGRVAVSRAIRTLIAAGIIERRRQRRKVNVYTVRLDLPAADTSKAEPSGGLDVPVANTSKSHLMNPKRDLDVSDSPGLDVPPVDTQTDQNRLIGTDDDVACGERYREADDQPVIAAKLRNAVPDLTDKQIDDALRKHPKSTRLWATVGLAGAPGWCMNRRGYVVKALRDGATPQMEPKTAPAAPYHKPWVDPVKAAAGAA